MGYIVHIYTYISTYTCAYIHNTNPKLETEMKNFCTNGSFSKTTVDCLPPKVL